MSLEGVEVFETREWRIESGNGGGILTSERDDEICETLKVTNLPDQVFEGHYLKMEHKGKKVLEFTAVQAIEAAKVSKEEAAKDVKCTYSDLWKKKDVDTFHSGLHWTYEMQNFTGVDPAIESKEGGTIDIALLQDTSQPIQHFMSADLFEDDLDDCGTSKVTLKSRTMPTCWFVLLRQFIRVDRVRVIVKDVRWFHKFGTNEMTMQATTRLKDIEDMATDASMHSDDSPPLKLYTNPDQLAQTLPVTKDETRTFIL